MTCSECFVRDFIVANSMRSGTFGNIAWPGVVWRYAHQPSNLHRSISYDIVEFASVSRLEMTLMDREQVGELERLVEQSLAEIFRQTKVERLLSRNQPLPNAKTLHLMAKAAITVYEATESER